MNTSSYKCTCCEGVFDKAWSDEEADKEYKEQFGDQPDRVIVCDDCYKKMMNTLNDSESPKNLFAPLIAKMLSNLPKVKDNGDSLPSRVLDLPHHRTYLDAITAGVPRSRALVRMEDTPLYTAWMYLRSQGNEYRAINPLVHYWLLERPQIKLRHVKMHIEEWRGIRGGA